MASCDAASVPASDLQGTQVGLERSRPGVSQRLRMPSRRALAVLCVVTAALWGMVVDSPLIPVLVPTGNSTLFQVSTAALFALPAVLLILLGAHG